MLDSPVPGSVPAGWSAELSWIDVAGVRAATEQKRNYLDKKIIFVADNISTTPLDLIVNPRSADGHLWLCQVRSTCSRLNLLAQALCIGKLYQCYLAPLLLAFTAVVTAQVSRGFGKYPSTMGDLGSAAVVMAEKYSGGGGDVKKQSPSTARVLTMKKVPGDGDECFQSVETISGMTKISIQKAKAAVQVRLVSADSVSLYVFTRATSADQSGIYDLLVKGQGPFSKDTQVHGQWQYVVLMMYTQ